MTSRKELDDHIVNDFNMLVDSCANLVEVVGDESSQYSNYAPELTDNGTTVRFVHYSVKEFLLSTAQGQRNVSTIDARLPEPETAHDTIASHFPTYLLFTGNEDDFIIYAILCWKKHV